MANNGAFFRDNSAPCLHYRDSHATDMQINNKVQISKNYKAPGMHYTEASDAPMCGSRAVLYTYTSDYKSLTHRYDIPQPVTLDNNRHAICVSFLLRETMWGKNEMRMICFRGMF